MSERFLLKFNINIFGINNVENMTSVIPLGIYAVHRVLVQEVNCSLFEYKHIALTYGRLRILSVTDTSNMKRTFLNSLRAFLSSDGGVCLISRDVQETKGSQNPENLCHEHS